MFIDLFLENRRIWYRGASKSRGPFAISINILKNIKMCLGGASIWVQICTTSNGFCMILTCVLPRAIAKTSYRWQNSMIPSDFQWHIFNKMYGFYISFPWIIRSSLAWRAPAEVCEGFWSGVKFVSSRFFFSTPKGKIVEFAIGVLQIEGSFSNLNILKGVWESEQYKLKLIEIRNLASVFEGSAWSVRQGPFNVATLRKARGGLRQTYSESRRCKATIPIKTFTDPLAGHRANALRIS